MGNQGMELGSCGLRQEKTKARPRLSDARNNP